MKKRTAEFVVRADLPRGVSRDEFAAYIRRAVRVWAGSMDPESPLFGLDWRSVKVRALPAAKGAGRV